MPQQNKNGSFALNLGEITNVPQRNVKVKVKSYGSGVGPSRCSRSARLRCSLDTGGLL